MPFRPFLSSNTSSWERCLNTIVFAPQQPPKAMCHSAGKYIGIRWFLYVCVCIYHVFGIAASSVFGFPQNDLPQTIRPKTPSRSHLKDVQTSSHFIRKNETKNTSLQLAFAGICSWWFPYDHLSELDIVRSSTVSGRLHIAFPNVLQLGSWTCWTWTSFPLQPQVLQFHVTW